MRGISARGFTLIEMALVIMISGLVIGALAEFYRVYQSHQKFTYTVERISAVEQNLAPFQSNQMVIENSIVKKTGRYPCPADPSLDLADPQSGEENCDIVDTLAVGTCTGPGNTGICRVLGRITATGEQLNVLIGAVPYTTLMSGLSKNLETDTQIEGGSASLANSLSYSYALDSWGRKLIYAVPEKLSADIKRSNAKFDAVYGAITVQSEHGLALTDPVGTAQYLVMSAGENGAGAYTQYGTQAWPCSDGSAEEQRNCDNTDAVFVQGLRQLATGADYFDDFILFSSARSTLLWEDVNPDDPSKGIYNANTGRVGIGMNNPTYMLDVATTAGNNGGVFAERYFATKELCSDDGSNLEVKAANNEWRPCLKPAVFGGYDYTGHCYPSDATSLGIMTGIGWNRVLCTQMQKPKIQLPARCPAGQLLRGINAAGGMVCETPVIP
jgi:prepilin-type N-terminal cleavage/methylation domain-containing protein